MSNKKGGKPPPQTPGIVGGISLKVANHNATLHWSDDDDGDDIFGNGDNLRTPRSNRTAPQISQTESLGEGIETVGQPPRKIARGRSWLQHGSVSPSLSRAPMRRPSFSLGSDAESESSVREGETQPTLRRVDFDFNFNDDRVPGEHRAAMLKARDHLKEALAALENIDRSRVKKWPVEVVNLVAAIQGVVGPTNADLGIISNLTQTVRGQQQTISDLTKLLSNPTDLPKAPNIPTPARTEQGGRTAAMVVKSQNPEPIRPTPQKSSKRDSAGVSKTLETPQDHPKGRHSPYRLTIRCRPSIPFDKRGNPVQLREIVNNCLNELGAPTGDRVSGVEYTDNGNINVYARAGSSAKKLLVYAAEFGKRIVPPSHHFVPTLDEAWYKVLLTGVSTIAPNGVLIDDDQIILEELRQNAYIRTEDMAEPPRYVTPPDRLGEKQKTAMVLTFRNEDAARYLIKTAKGLWYMGEYVRARTFEDRRPVRPCERCYSLHHTTKHCQGRTPRCRFCNKEHWSVDHRCEQCGTTGECTHVQCVNCGGKHKADDLSCPERTRKTGVHTTAKAAKSSAPQKPEQAVSETVPSQPVLAATTTQSKEATTQPSRTKRGTKRSKATEYSSDALKALAKRVGNGATEDDAWTALETANGEVKRAEEILRKVSSMRNPPEETDMQVDATLPAHTA